MDVDPMLVAYQGVADRIITIVTAATPDDLDSRVPACPDWTARQVVAHLAGLCEDWVDGNLDQYGTDDWAASQVDRFEGQPLGDVIDAWQRALGPFGELTESPLGATPARWAFGDALAHEADLRPVLAAGSRPPDEAIAVGLKAAISRWRSELSAAGAPNLKIIVPGHREWLVGEAVADVTTLTVDAYELYRALFGRRSLNQAKAWQWSTDSAPWLAVDLPFPFSWAETSLAD